MSRALVALIIVAASSQAHAHGMRTVYVELVESTAGNGIGSLRFTRFDPTLRITLDGCTLTSATGDGTPNSAAFVFHCPASLAGRRITVDGLGGIVSEAVVRVALADGTIRSGVLRTDAPSLTLPAHARSAVAVAIDYVRLGITHIATGFDHLLFLLALALQLWRVRAVIIAETAFTISHTLTFSLTALGLVRLSPAAAEACIALSLLMLARELLTGRRVTPRRGAVVALLFGLVHGLGFASGLSEIGLPKRDVGVALVGFGVGVELGQIAFLLLVLTILHHASVSRRRQSIAALGGIAIGCVGAYWLFERLAEMWRA